MRRIVTWFLSTVTVVVLLFGYHTSTSGAPDTAPDTVVSSTPQPGATTPADPGAGSSGAARTGGGGGSASRPAETVTGPVVQTQWGPVQVQVTSRGGQITRVSVLQHPDGNPNDQQINAYALPILVQETLDAQSAHIHMVSGATVTSYGYLQSLQAALDQAGL